MKPPWLPGEPEAARLNPVLAHLADTRAVGNVLVVVFCPAGDRKGAWVGDNLQRLVDQARENGVLDGAITFVGGP
jgi:hypothetical protein